MENKLLFDKYKEGRHWENHPTIYAENFSDFLKEENFSGLLVDVGCGNGRDANVFAKEGFNVLGIDYSESEINLCREKFPELKFEVQNSENMNLENDSVSGIFCINVMHYVDKEKTLKEFFRVLKKGGLVFIHFNLEIKDMEGNTDYFQDEKEVMELVSDFEIIRKKKFQRHDIIPKEHDHEILELILRKN